MVTLIYDWMDRYPKAMRYIQTFNAVWLAYFLIMKAWEHNIPTMCCFAASLVLVIVALHVNFRDDRDDEDEAEEDDPDMPTGDAVDRWVRSRISTTPRRKFS